MVVNLQPFVTERDSIEVLDTEKTRRIRKLLALQYGKVGERLEALNSASTGIYFTNNYHPSRGYVCRISHVELISSSLA